MDRWRKDKDRKGDREEHVPVRGFNAAQVQHFFSASWEAANARRAGGGGGEQVYKGKDSGWTTAAKSSSKTRAQLLQELRRGVNALE